jgi:hypothetical protein
LRLKQLGKGTLNGSAIFFYSTAIFSTANQPNKPAPLEPAFPFYQTKHKTPKPQQKQKPTNKN